MEFLVGSVLTATLVLLLLVAVWGPSSINMRADIKALKVPAYMLLVAVPSLIAPTNLLELMALASSAIAVYELILIVL